jgi:uncharacterized protein YndB with AHSA1/START domain
VADIKHRVGIKADLDSVYQALATRDGLASWLTRDVRGGEQAGSELELYFRDVQPGAVMEIVELRHNQLVRWRCTGGVAAEWLNTDVTFELKREGDETVVLFSHDHWQAATEFLHHCSTAWAVFLLSLKDGLEGGRFTPFPEVKRVSAWS